MADLPIGVNVAINPAMIPTVEAVLAAGDGFVAAWTALAPHLKGAFGSLSSQWVNATEAQKAALLAGSPNLVHAMSIFASLKALMADVPELESS